MVPSFDFKEPFQWILTSAGFFIALGVIMFCVGAIQLALSKGDEQKAFFAKLLMKRALVGIIVLVLCVALARMIIRIVWKA